MTDALDLLIPDQKADAWKADASCRGHDPSIWFPPERLNAGEDAEDTARARGPIYAEARAICETCPYTGIDGPCYAEAVEVDRLFGRYGMRAGLTPHQRKRRAPRRPPGGGSHRPDPMSFSEAELESEYESRNRKRSPVPIEGNWTHGKIGTYNAGCGCPPCYEAAADARARYRPDTPAGRRAIAKASGADLAQGRVGRTSPTHLRGVDDSDHDQNWTA